MVERLFSGAGFCRTCGLAAQQRAIAACHQRMGLFEEALGSAAFVGCLPCRTAPQSHAGVDQRPGQFVERHWGWRGLLTIDEGKQQIEPLALEGTRLKSRCALERSNSGQKTHQALGCLSSQIAGLIGYEHDCERLIGVGARSHPEVMRAIGCADDEVAAIDKHLVVQGGLASRDLR